MFAGRSGLAMTGDHIDLSYANAQDWPSFTPGGSIRSHAFDMGDELAGPRVHLASTVPVEGETLDWQHSIDPAHYHGTDQFRLISGGRWILANQPLERGSLAFQEAGVPYREHPGGEGRAWFLLIYGDRRGAAATIIMKKDRETLFRNAEASGRIVDDPARYPHPAGPRGVAAVATTAGSCDRGYLLRRLAALGDDGSGFATLTGVFGDREVGPAVHALRHASEEMVLPAAIHGTETLLAVVDGSCAVGDRRYGPGDVRIQAAGRPMEAICSGPEGLQAVLIVADRRATSVALGDGALPAWWGAVAGLLQ